jgi:hypothetical protein
VPPGQEGKITLGIDHTESYLGEVAKSASVSTNDPKYPSFNLVLRAYFKTLTPPTGSGAPDKFSQAAKYSGPFSISPNDRWVTSVITGSSTSTRLYLYNRETAPVHVKKVEPGGDNFTLSLQTIEDGKRYEVNLSTNPALKPGQYSQIARVLTDSASAPEIAIRLDVTVFPQVFVSPASIILPKLPLASDVASINLPVIYVRKVREGGLKIAKVSSTLPFLNLQLVTETEGQFYTVRITLDKSKITGTGDFKGTIRIETNDAQNPVLEVPFQCSFI